AASHRVDYDWLKIALTHLGHLGQLALANRVHWTLGRDSKRTMKLRSHEPPPPAPESVVAVWLLLSQRQLVRFVLPLEEAKRGLRMLQEAGMQKVNFSGGEPFLEAAGRLLGEMVSLLHRRSLGLQARSASSATAASSLRRRWFHELWRVAGHPSRVLRQLRRGHQPGHRTPRARSHHLDKLYQISEWCARYRVAFKINTVEDMADQILDLNPCRWKVFQCLLIGGENCGEDSLRHAETFVVTDEQFRSFLDRHSRVECLVPESNEKMRDSYLILDERMRFLDCTRGRKEPSRSILDVGVANAICSSGFDEAMFSQARRSIPVEQERHHGVVTPA
uniref:Photolyase/cryptochrome alpha/beta domain-containing protein n=1 Tax=Macrostomum lignano TaxID=282301 RepID=A0A1I8F9P5_9PLAT